jgi:hypothetical protein
MNLNFTKNRSWQLITLDELNEFETLIGFSLPKDYKEFMLKHNGGIIENLKHINFPNDNQGLSRLFSITYDSGYTMEKIFLKNTGRFPNGYLSIGVTNYGGEIIISLNNDETFGNIKEWISEEYNNYLSPSFTQLLNDQIDNL